MKKLFISLCLCLVTALQAGIDSRVDRKPIHEAFVTKITAPIPIEVIAERPPAPRSETPPPQPSSEMIWIPGYYSWDREANEFVWVCGVWRRPPANHRWVSGYWKENGGWFWLAGFWQQELVQALYAQNPPPSMPEERPGNPPNDNSFWMNGYWEFDKANQKFNWLSGSWQAFDPQWVLVPAHWQWRPEGYLFHPSFWDFPLDARGVAYDCNATELIPIEPTIIISRIYYCYPDYIFIFWHHWHFHPHFWGDCWCLPPWWGWGGWWTFNWHNHWWLWWWWSHPMFPPPFWLSLELAQMIAPPDVLLIDFFKHGKLPFFFTPKGVPLDLDWLKAIDKLTGKKDPLLPDNLWQDAANEAGNSLPTPPAPVPPTGKPGNNNVPKPDIGTTIPPTGRAPLPPFPVRPFPGGHAQLPEKPSVTSPTPPSSGQPNYPTQPSYPPDSSSYPPSYPPNGSNYPPDGGTYPPRPHFPPDGHRPHYPPDGDRPHFPPGRHPPTNPPDSDATPPSGKKPTYPPSNDNQITPPSSNYPPSTGGRRPNYPSTTQPLPSSSYQPNYPTLQQNPTLRQTWIQQRGSGGTQGNYNNSQMRYQKGQDNN